MKKIEGAAMQLTTHYDSPLGGILLAADEQGLTGLWFDGEKYYANHLSTDHRKGNLPALEKAMLWLDIYFSGEEPSFMPPIHMIGTDFQMSVWNILLQIPYGKTISYGEIAARIAAGKGLAKMSAQAVGGAVGHNNISILVPCHRVVGKSGSLTGYAGGIDKKVALLKLEKVNMDVLFTPKRGTAL